MLVWIAAPARIENQKLYLSTSRKVPKRTNTWVQLCEQRQLLLPLAAMMRLLLLLACLGSVAYAMEPIMTPTDIDTCSNSSECQHMRPDAAYPPFCPACCQQWPLQVLYTDDKTVF